MLFLDGNHEYGVKGLKYLGLRQRTEPRGTLCDYYEIKGRYYIKITIPDLKKLKKPKKLKFSGKTVDEARKKYVDYFSPHDIRQAPDGTSGQYDKFIRDALLGNLHGCSLEKRVKK